MLCRILLPALLVLGGFLSAPSAQASDGYQGYPFFYGFYQPYGIRYSTSVRTPPYFAVNPPVYYGARHTRPYGVSPFASLPLVEAGDGYKSRAADPVMQPPAMICNPFCATAVDAAPRVQVVEEPIAAKGPMQSNPYVTRIALSSTR